MLDSPGSATLLLFLLTWSVVVLLLAGLVRWAGVALTGQAALRASLGTCALLLVAAFPLTAGFESGMSVEIPTAVLSVGSLGAGAAGSAAERGVGKEASPPVNPAAASAGRSPALEPMTPSSIEEPWSARALRVVFSALALLWLAGGVFMLVRIVIARWRLSQLLAGSQPVDAMLEQEIRGLTDRVSHRRLSFRIRRHTAITHPFVCGIVRPTLVLPAWLDRPDHPHLPSVVIHEVAHLSRRDLWVGRLELALRVPLWFHPGLTWIRSEVSRAREEVCDNHVLREVDGATYSRTLFTIAQLRPQRAPLAALGLLDSPWRLEDRIRGLIDGRRSRMTRAPLRPFVLLALIGTGLVATAATLQPRFVAAEEPESLADETKPATPQLAAKDEATSLRLAMPVKMGCENQPLEKVFEFVAAVSGLNLVVDPNVALARKVLDLEAGEYTLSKVLFFACYGNFLDYRLEDGVVRIGSFGKVSGTVDPRAWPSAEDTQGFEKALSMKWGAGSSDSTLGEVLGKYKELDIPVIIDRRIQRTKKIELEKAIDFDVAEDATRREFLAQLAKSMNWVTVEHRGVTLITNAGTGAAMQAMFAAAAAAEKEE